MPSTMDQPDELARQIEARPARLGRTRLVAIDGPSGAGKTVLADEVAARFGDRAVVVHTDDLLDGWDDQFTYWARLETQILQPVRDGRAGRYRRYDWIEARFGDAAVTVPPKDVLILDGVGSARAEIRPELTFSVFVTAAPDVCLARALARDGEAIRPRLRIWQRREAEFFAADGTEAAADLVISR